MSDCGSPADSGTSYSTCPEISQGAGSRTIDPIGTQSADAHLDTLGHGKVVGLKDAGVPASRPKSRV